MTSDIVWSVLSIEDAIDELKELNEYFDLYYEALQHQYTLALELHGIHLKQNRLHLHVEAHEHFTEKLLGELELRVRNLREVVSKSENEVGVKL